MDFWILFLVRSSHRQRRKSAANQLQCCHTNELCVNNDVLTIGNGLHKDNLTTFDCTHVMQIQLIQISSLYQAFKPARCKIDIVQEGKNT